ncbi:ABC transporter substrate-binding protein [Opitutus terrae]|uniref:Extracellular solute-binding protein family 1 n=1 Tax=Opitutus terrae (strain DSM 11246 / JCM 15787 / PB90-1) TaxID=452637 RepID=B2A086_OPITP|nr:sugar ABC transporter substrate-binding protein [Opitutus terrae]ACB77422.1 extracellular solute-binding protein family 1 [Opitutus terrae PB90-1]
MRLPFLPSLLLLVSLFSSLAPAAPGGLHALRELRVWCHQGQEQENLAMRAIAAEFNRAHADRGIHATLTFFPDYHYTEKIAIAAAAHDLPDVLDLDGPLVARYVDAGLLAPIDHWFSVDELADFLPTLVAQGTIEGRLYALGAFESAVVLYYDRDTFARAGVEAPPPGVAWSWSEFLAACQRLRDAGFEPVALHLDESADEWFTYAFSPLVWSAGGKLIQQQRVRGVLDSPAAVRALQAWQQVFRRGFAATDPVNPDPFGSGEVAMDWSGHWMARRHVEAKADRLGVMPLPRMGDHPVAPCGSWCWGISASARDPAAAALWLRWITDARHGIEPLVRANGAVPARRSAFAFFPEYAQPPYSLFRTQLEQFARPRPRTPHYATLTQRFAAALRDIAHGADVEPRLRAAADEIQSVINRRIHAHDTSK